VLVEIGGGEGRLLATRSLFYISFSSCLLSWYCIVSICCNAEWLLPLCKAGIPSKLVCFQYKQGEGLWSTKGRDAGASLGLGAPEGSFGKDGGGWWPSSHVRRRPGAEHTDGERALALDGGGVARLLRRRSRHI